MKLALFAIAALLSACGQSKTDEQLERIVSRLDAIEARQIDMDGSLDEIKTEVDNLDTAVENIDCAR
jgi:archaellum component FlaC